MPRDGSHVDEINALMGHQMSMADLPTSMMTRSPGPPAYSKLNMGMTQESSSMLIAPGSTHAAYQQSSKDIGESYGLDGFLGNSPDIKNRNNRAATFASHPQKIKENTRQQIDDYEDLLDNIERENDSYKATKGKNIIPGSEMTMLNQRNGKSKLIKKSGSVGFESQQSSTQMGASKMFGKTIEEPIIDFELEKELSTIEINENVAPAKTPASKKVALKANLNQSSDFDLDNY